jgi:hypothetical protein
MNDTSAMQDDSMVQERLLGLNKEGIAADFSGMMDGPD